MNTASEAVIEVSIPMRYFEYGNDIAECTICARPMCPNNRCCLAPTATSCCDQPMCCECFVKILKACKCTTECQEVVGICPFCRDMCRATVANVFKARHTPCSACRAGSKA